MAIFHNENNVGTILLVFIVSILLLGCDKAVENNDKTKSKTLDQVSYYNDIGDWKAPKPLMAIEEKDQITRPAVLQFKGSLSVLYSTNKKLAFIRNKNEVVLDKLSGTNKLWLFTDNKEKNLYAFWWKKTKEGKRLYFSGSLDQGKTFSKKVVVNTAGGVLPTIGFSGDGNGNIVVAYYDERNPPYRIYVNHSSDNGITWGSQDVRIDNDKNTRLRKTKGKDYPIAYAINPLLGTLESGKLVLVWQQRKMINGNYRLEFVSRTSIDQGKTWGDEQVIYISDNTYTVESSLTTSGNKVILVAAFPQKGLLSFYAADNHASNNLNWSDLGAAKGTTNANAISWLKPAMSPDKFKVAYIIQKDIGKKYHVEVASLDLEKGTWGASFRLDRAKKQPVDMKATYLDLKVLPNGEFIVAWEDYQYFIPVLMLDYTKDKGTKWQSEPIKLTRGGLSQIKYPNIYVDKDKVTVVFEWYVQRGGELPVLSYIEIPIDQKGSLKVVPAPQGKKYTKSELEKKLKKRAIELMDFRVKGNWEKTWDYMDPVYREVTNKDSWLKNMGYISYEKYRVVKVDVDGRFGTVDIDMTISLRQQFRKGKIMEPTPPKSALAKTKWLWFYDNWYFYPDSEFIRHLNF